MLAIWAEEPLAARAIGVLEPAPSTGVIAGVGGARAPA